MKASVAKVFLESWNRLVRANAMEADNVTDVGFTKLKGRTNDVAYSSNLGDTLQLTFTGSNFNGFEWASNLSVLPWKGYHMGFYRTAKRMRETLYCNYETLYSLKHCDDVGIDAHSRGVYGVILAKLMIDDKRISEEQLVNADGFGLPPYVTSKGFRKLNGTPNLNVNIVDLENDIVSGKRLWMKTYYDKMWMLPNVKGEFDHCAYKEALEKVIQQG